MPHGLFCTYKLDESNQQFGGVKCILIFLLDLKNQTFKAKSVDPDQMPHLWHLIWVYTVC